ncbi:MAG: cbb3-type cytochrome c oxidase subunit I, partial [Natronospirillum sp.]|uniref:cbb3-type cytochrome c oxidase subunit I n=1 Tax=Natronospirillum sp. TaxID=2812955 RepID=UPI0025ECD155
WYILAMALMIVFGFPPLILASILLELERAVGMPFFDPGGGGDPLLWQHLFWLFGHPEVYIIFLPAAGIVSTLIPVFSGRPLVGYRWVVLSIIVTGFISFGLWVHHMFTVGIPQLAQAFFSVASMLVAVPTAIQVFAWLATLWTGRVRFTLPMLWIFGFLVIFVCGGLTGVMLALVPFNWQVHDTHFVVAHMHYVLVGGMFFPLIAGLYYWLPHATGRMPSERLGHWGFWLTFIGFNATFLLMHLTGLLGMPRRVYTYEAGMGWDWLNLLSSVGGFIMATGVAMIILDLLLHSRFGRRAPNNPWHADTLEWATATPPASYNFASQPTVTSRHPMWDQPDVVHQMAAGEGHLAEIQQDQRDTLGTDAVTAKVTQRCHLPGNTWLPLLAAGALAVVCIGLLIRLYPLAAAACVVAAVILLRWSWLNGGHPQAAPLTDAEQTNNDDNQSPLLESRTFDGPGRWGMIVTMMANGTLYASLLFGWFYLWTASPQWSAPADSPLPALPLITSALLATVLTLLYRRQVSALRAGQDQQLTVWLAGLTLLGALITGMVLWVLISAPLAATELAHDAVLTVMLIYLFWHSGLATVLTGLQTLRAKLGYVSARLPYEAAVLQPFWVYTSGVFWLSLAAFIGLPMAWGGG